MERSTIIAEVWIGDCEGRNLAPMFMIELNEDEYEVVYECSDYQQVRLTEDGLDRFRDQYDCWDVDYYNYEIRAFANETAVQHEYEQLLKCQAELNKKINMLGEWLGL